MSDVIHSIPDSWTNNEGTEATSQERSETTHSQLLVLIKLLIVQYKTWTAGACRDLLAPSVSNGRSLSSRVSRSPRKHEESACGIISLGKFLKELLSLFQRIRRTYLCEMTSTALDSFSSESVTRQPSFFAQIMAVRWDLSHFLEWKFLCSEQAGVACREKVNVWSSWTEVWLTTRLVEFRRSHWTLRGQKESQRTK